MGRPPASRRDGGPAPGPGRGFGPAEPADLATPQVAPPGALAEAAIALAEVALRAVLDEQRHSDRAVQAALKHRRDLAAPDTRFLTAAIASLFRWRGWVELAAPGDLPAQLMLATLMDLPTVHPACRVWARMAGRDPGRLSALGDAPTWTTKSEGFKRLVGRPIAVDPWRLFPPWFREALPLPPGDGAPKTRQVEFIRTLQTPAPTWVRVQGAEPERIWDELRALGLKPWVHRRIPTAARLDPDVDMAALPPVQRGQLEVQDLAAQAVGMACDPEPGERWWDAFGTVGGHAIHLAALLQGKGVVVATDTRESRLKGLVLKARRSPFRNITTRAWDGKHVAGKAGSYAGVLVAPPGSALGTWRRHPDDRWLANRESVDRLAAQGLDSLLTASAGVRPGGVLVYAAATLTLAETTSLIGRFLEARPNFRLDPFPHPLTGDPTDGQLTLWPQQADTDGHFLARLIRNP